LLNPSKNLDDWEDLGGRKKEEEDERKKKNSTQRQ